MEMRHRSRSASPDIETSEMHYYYPNTSKTRKSPTYGVAYTNTLVETIDDVVTEDFEKLKSAGVVINNPLLQTKASFSQSVDPFENFLGPTLNPDGSVKTELSGFHDRGTMSAERLMRGISFPQPPDDFGDSFADIAVTDAWANIDKSSLMSLVSAKEARETVSSITSILGRFIRILRNVRKLRVSELYGEASPSEIRDRWLEARYAVRPLIGEAQDLIEAWNAEIKYDRETARGYKHDSWTGSEPQAVNAFSSFTTHCTANTSLSVECRAGVLYHVELEGLRESLAIWGIDQPIESAWELLPFSFIIDWFFNIGKTIASWTPNSGITPLASWVKTTKVLVERATTDSLVVVPGRYSDQVRRGRYVNGSGSFTRILIDIQRSPDPRRPILPRFDLNLDVLKLVDLLAIGTQLSR